MRVVEVNSENLLAYGYTKHPPSGRGENVLFQKTWRNGAGLICYFLNFTEWQFDDISVIRYDADMQIKTSDGQILNIQFLCPDSIEIVEKWAENLWLATGSVYSD